MRTSRFTMALLSALFLGAMIAHTAVAAEGPATTAPGAAVDDPCAQPSPKEMAAAAGVTLPKSPWHVANIWWDFEKPVEHFESLEMEITVDRDVPSTYNLYVSPVGLAKINGLQFYGGLQTNINGWATKESRERVHRGKGAIFSRWSSDKKTPIGLEHARMAAEDCLVESAGYEGEFASVRRPLAWTKGTWTYLIVKGEKEKVGEATHTWFNCQVRDPRGEIHKVGSLRFEGEDFTYWDRHSAFVEVYSTAKIPRSNIPMVNVTFGWPKINGQKVALKKASAYYPAKTGPASPDCAWVKEDGEKCRVEVGPIFVRDEAKRRHALNLKRDGAAAVPAATAVLAGVDPSATAVPAAAELRPAGIEFGVATYTFRHLTAFEAIEKTKECGGDVIELFLWQKLSPDEPKVVLNMNLGEAQIAALKAKLKAAGVRPVNAYFNNAPFQDKANVEANVRKLFEFAKKLGLRGLTGEPPIEHLDLVEKMVKEYDVQLCFHNHPRDPRKPEYRNWEPAYLLSLMEKRDPRMGFSMDTGHLARSGVDAVEAVKLLKGRILSVHLKDVKEARPESGDVPYGQGIANIAGVVAELQRQGFRGHLAVEYEHTTDHLLDDVKQCLAFMRQQVKETK